MPTIANKTIKKYDGITDILWTGVNGSSGDKVPAIYRSNTVGGNISVRPEFRHSARSSGNGELSVRRSTAEIYYPEFYTIDGQQKVVNRAWGSCTFNAPTAMSDSVKQEAAYQFVHMLMEMRFGLATGFPET